MYSKDISKKMYVSPVLGAVEADKSISLGMLTIHVTEPDMSASFVVSYNGVEYTYTPADHVDEDGDIDFTEVLKEGLGLSGKDWKTFAKTDSYKEITDWITNYVNATGKSFYGASADASAFGASDAWGESSSPFGN